MHMHIWHVSYYVVYVGLALPSGSVICEACNLRIYDALCVTAIHVCVMLKVQCRNCPSTYVVSTQAYRS